MLITLCYDWTEAEDSGYLYFCFRWLLIRFKREFIFRDVQRLWEVRPGLAINHRYITTDPQTVQPINRAINHVISHWNRQTANGQPLTILIWTIDQMNFRSPNVCVWMYWVPPLHLLDCYRYFKSDSFTHLSSLSLSGRLSLSRSLSVFLSLSVWWNGQ